VEASCSVALQTRYPLSGAFTLTWRVPTQVCDELLGFTSMMLESKVFLASPEAEAVDGVQVPVEPAKEHVWRV
jgi:hypothetical protein